MESVLWQKEAVRLENRRSFKLPSALMRIGDRCTGLFALLLGLAANAAMLLTQAATKIFVELQTHSSLLRYSVALLRSSNP